MVEMETSAPLEIQKAVHERDQMWKLHEKAQISFLQNQNTQMLSHLHTEIDRLMNINRELNRRLNVSNSSDKEEELERQLENEEQKNAELLEELQKNQKHTAVLEKTLEHTLTFYKDKITQHEDRIRQLTAELHDRTQTVTQLSSQLRSIKLREAMAQAQQRRRASCSSPKSPTSPAVSPNECNSAFRLFGLAKDFARQTHSPSTQKTIRLDALPQPHWPDPMLKENNIEKPRTLSTSYITARPRHLASLRRAGSTSGDNY
jgi:predicted DNA-binding ribbon-helix-helix protein